MKFATRSLFLLLMLVQLQVVSSVNLDSLRAVWNNASLDDTTRLNAMQLIAWEGYLFTQPDSAYIYAQQQIDFAQKNGLIKYVGKALNTQGASFAIQNQADSAIPYYRKAMNYFKQVGDKKGVASILNNTGNIFLNWSEYDSALSNYNRSLTLLKELKDKKGVAQISANIGNIYVNKGDYANGIDYHSISLNASESIKDSTAIGNALNNLGIIYNYLGQYEKAIEYYNKSIQCFETDKRNNLTAIAYALGNIGTSYSYLHENQKALNYYKRAISLHNQLGNPFNNANAYHNIGTILLEQGEYDSALVYIFKTIGIYEEFGYESEMILPIHNAGRCYFLKNDINNAKKYSTKSYKIAKKVNSLEGLSNYYDLQYMIAKKEGSYKKALEMFELHSNIQDSLLSEENQRKLLRQEYQYEYDKKTAADSIKAAEEKALTDAKLVAQKAQLDKEKIQRYALFGGICVSLLFGVFIYNRFRITRKQRDIIEEQKDEVEKQKIILGEKNKEILDSINYAKRIQNAILPSKATIQELLPHSFILYQPKDVVAGDFYWLERKGDTVLFAAADCTGHGVPGAMVSVVCNNALNQSVREFGLTDPGDILNKTREIVVSEFEKSDENVQDGMDIALCSLKGNTLSFSGANLPLWLVRNNEVIVRKGDKQPIGKYDSFKPFNTHSVPLEKGDTIYIFSDGIIDQFGGEKGKKLMAKRLKEILLSVQSSPLKDQKKFIGAELEKWRGEHEQVDDVCIIGVKFD